MALIPSLRLSFGVTAIACVTLFLLVASSALAPWLAPFDPIFQDPNGLGSAGAPLPPSVKHPLGTDDLGRDVLSRLLYGGRASLAIAIVATLGTAALGISLGMVAGFFGGKVDACIMRLTEVVMAFPTLLLAIALAAVMPSGMVSVIITLTLVGWTSLTRVVRSAVLSLREQEFIEASRAIGVPQWRLLIHHIWPNVRALSITMATLKLADILLLEAALGFLGLGIAPPTPTWGSLVSEGRHYLFHSPWLGLPAGFAIFLTVLTINILADRAHKRRS